MMIKFHVHYFMCHTMLKTKKAVCTVIFIITIKRFYIKCSMFLVGPVSITPSVGIRVMGLMITPHTWRILRPMQILCEMYNLSTNMKCVSYNTAVLFSCLLNWNKLH